MTKQSTPPKGSAKPATTPRRPRSRLVAWGAVAALVVVGPVVVWLAADGSAPAPGSPFVGGDLHSLVIDPDQPQTIYIGGHEAVSRSTDGGGTWERVPSLDDADAMGWAFTEDAILVSGHPGVAIDRGGRLAFARINDGLPHTDVHALGAGGGWIYGAGPGAGVFASADGGATWETRTTQAGQAFFGRILVEADGSTLLASDVRLGPVRSADGGQTWTALGGLPSVWLTRNADVVVSSGPAGASVSSDGGRTWVPFGVPSGALMVEADPADPARFMAAGLDGRTVRLWASTDSGVTWTML